MAEFAGLIKYPSPTDVYNSTYGEPQWWKDLAITAQAQAAEAADAAKFNQGTPSSAGDLDNYVNPGTYGYWSAAAHTPTSASGTLIVTNVVNPSTGEIALVSQLAIITGISEPTLWSRFKGSTGYSSWIRIDVGAVELPPAPEVPLAMKAASAGGMKSAPLALTTGWGGSQTTGTGTTVVIQRMPKMVERAQLHLENRNPRYTLPDSPAVTVSAVQIGLHNGSGGSTLWTDVPGSGSTSYKSGWIDVPQAWRGQDIAVKYTWSSAGTIQMNIGTGWTGGVRETALPLWAWLECSVPASTTVVGAYGDSLSAGVTASRPIIDSWIVQWAQDNNAFPAHWAHSGDASTTWTDTADRKWFLYGLDVAAPDAMIYAMGSNEVYGGASPTLAVMQQRVTDTVAMIKEKISPVVYGALIMPRTSVTDETLRRQVNTWYATNGLFRQVFDFVTPISADDDNILPEYDGDGIHLNTAGYTQIAGAVPGSIIPATTRSLPPRLVPLTTAGATGSIRLHRDGSVVTIEMNGITVPTGSFPVFLVTLPAGYGYTGQNYFIATDASTSQVPSIMGMYSANRLAWVRDINWGSARPTEQLYGQYQYMTTDPMPTT